MSVKLSIIVPVYNMAADNKLIHCLDSLVNQRFRDFEIIAVDDASTDNSLEILNDYQKRYSDFFKVIANKKNKRQGGAKNSGLKMATGEWVGFIDSDDWIDPSMYEKLIAKAEETTADIVGCDYTIVDHYTFDEGMTIENNSMDQTGELTIEKHKLHILKPGSMVVKIYKHAIIKENNLSFPENIFYEDNQASIIWSFYFTHFERVNEPLYYYLTLADSTTHFVTWDKCKDRISAGKQLIDAAKERGFYERYKDEIDFKFGDLAYAGTLFSYMYSGKNRNLANANELRKLAMDYIPDFINNKYFEDRLPEENKKYIRRHMKSNFAFYISYRLLYGYRALVKKFRKR